MRKALFFVLIFTILFCSCNKKQEQDAHKTSGKINVISVIIEEQLWNGEVGDSLRNKFASPVIGLPQEEPLFTINQYPSKFLEGYVTTSRNILIVNRGKNSDFKIDEGNNTISQNKFYISGRTANALVEEIEEHTAEIIKKIRWTEIKENQRLIDTALMDVKKITDKFKIGIHIPKGYNYVLERQKFMWLKKEISSGNNSVLIYEVPFTCLKKAPSVIHNIIKMRDSIGNLYIHGTTPRTKMVTEDSYAPY
jgi:hypothetical protein